MKNPLGGASAGQGSLERFIANKTAVRKEEDHSTAFAQRICSNFQEFNRATPRVNSPPSNQIGALRDKDYWCSSRCSQNTKQHAGASREDPHEDLFPRKSSSTDHVALVTEVEEAIAAWVSGPQEIQRFRELRSCGEGSHHVALRHPKLQQQTSTSTSSQEPAAAGIVLSSFHSRRQKNICREGDHHHSAIRPRKPPGYDHHLNNISTPFQQIAPVVRHPYFQSISTSRNHDLIQRFPPRMAMVSSKASPPKVAQRVGVRRHELYPLPLPPQDIRLLVKAEPDLFFPSTAPVRHIVTHTGITNERTNPMPLHVQEEQTPYQISAGTTQRMNFLPKEEVPVVHSDEMMMMSPGSSPSEEDSGEAQQEFLVRGGRLSQEAINPMQRDVDSHDDTTPPPAAMPHAAVLERNETPDPRTLDNLIRKISAIRAPTPQIPWESLVTVPNPSSDDRPVVDWGAPLLPPSPARQTVITFAPKTLAYAKSNSNRVRKRRNTFETVRAAFLGKSSSSRKFRGPLEPPIACPLCSAADRAGVAHKPCDHKFAFEEGGDAFHFHGGTLKPGLNDKSTKWIFGRVLDPRSQGIRRWNRLFLLSSTWSTAIDPLFFYLLSISKELSCLYVDRNFALAVTFLRTVFDSLKLVHMYLQFRLAYLSSESLVLGYHDLVWDARKVVHNYLYSGGSFLLDLYVIIPLPQMMVWWIIPDMIAQGLNSPKIMYYFLLTSLLQYIPRIFHTLHASRRMENVIGFVFGTAWWAFLINLTYYFLAAHIAGAYWYLLAIQNVQQCMANYCTQAGKDLCDPRYLGCPEPTFTGKQISTDESRLAWAKNTNITNTCLYVGKSYAGDYEFGIYVNAIPLTETSLVNRILFPLFWGLMTLSTFGNALTPSSQILEIFFCIVLVICGLVLFLLLIGNIQVFLRSIVSKKEEMQLRNRDLEWWMERRQLPHDVCQRVRRYERHRWAALRGVEESALVNDLPDAIRRDIKRHLCLQLVRSLEMVTICQKQEEMNTNCVLVAIFELTSPHVQVLYKCADGDHSEMVTPVFEEAHSKVKNSKWSPSAKRQEIPLFQHLDSIVLDSICERLKPQIFIRHEPVFKEGDPVTKMHFVSRGHFESSYRLNDSDYSLCVLGPGNFCGDELLSWALRQPHVETFPPSTATLKSLDVTEVFSLDASDLKYVTDHYRYKFETETLRRAVRFYSVSWRMWGALTIQLAWRRCKLKMAAKEAAFAVVRTGGKIGPPPKDDEEILGLPPNSKNGKSTDSNKRASKSLATVHEETDEETESMESIHEQDDAHMPDAVLPSSISKSQEKPD